MAIFLPTQSRWRFVAVAVNAQVNVNVNVETVWTDGLLGALVVQI